MENLVAAQEDTQQGIETRKVVHMGVCDKCVAHLKHFSGGKAVQVAQVEQEAAFFKKKRYEQGWIFKWAVDKPGMEGRPHRRRNLATWRWMQ